MLKLSPFFLLLLCMVTANSEKREVCLTPGCIHAASDVLKSMDETVDPCDDFYKFACGKFIKETSIPDDAQMVATTSKMNDIIQDRLRTMVEEPIEPNEPRPFVLMKKFYQSCMNSDAAGNKGLESVKKLLRELGGWPVLEGEDWNEAAFDVDDTMYKLRQKGLNTDFFLRFSVTQDPYNPMLRIIDIDEPPFTINREMLVKGFEHEQVQVFYNYLVDLAVIYGANSKILKKDIEDSLKFQVTLAQITLDNEQRRNFTALTNKMTIAEFQSRHPTFAVKEFINGIIDTPGTVVSDDEVINVGVPQYFVKLEELMNRTPKRVLANFVMGDIVQSLKVVLTQDLKGRINNNLVKITGTNQLPPQWKECVAVATSNFPLASSAKYVRNYFPREGKEIVEEMYVNLKDVLLKLIKNVDWMDETTKAEAIAKANSMISIVAYPEELLDDEKLNEYYSKLDASDNYFDYILNHSKFKLDKYFEELRQSIVKNDWKSFSPATDVNANYNVLTNVIVIAAGILQGQFFNYERPNYMNYAGIGFILGHELTHAFDDTGRQTDKDGRLRNWWSDATTKTFVDKAQCIIDQYSKISYPGVELTLSGINTQGENIADNGGMTEAYLAYKSWVDKHGEELPLPGLNYTLKQTFWISAANAWCSKERHQFLKQIVMSDPHPPSYYRIIGTLSNSKQFAEDFQCPVGSRMNPVHKCTIW